MSTLMDKYDFSANEFHNLDDATDIYGDDDFVTVNNWNDNGIASHANNNDALSVLPIQTNPYLNSTVNNNAFNDSDDDLPPPKPLSLQRFNSNIHPQRPQLRMNNINVQTLRSAPAQIVSNNNQQMPHSNCNCCCNCAHNISAPTYSSTQMTQYNPAPVCGLRDSMTANTLSIGQSFGNGSNGSTRTNDSFQSHYSNVSNLSLGSTQNSFYSNTSVNSNNSYQLSNQLSNVSNQSHLAVNNIASPMQKLRINEYSFKPNQSVCDCSNNYAMPMPSHTPMHTMQNTNPNNGEISLEALFGTLRNGIQSSEMALIIARMVQSICEKNKHSSDVQSVVRALINANIVNILQNAMDIHQIYPEIVQQCSRALNHLHRIQRQAQMQSQIQMTPPQRQYKTISALSPQGRVPSLPPLPLPPPSFPVQDIINKLDFRKMDTVLIKKSMAKGKRKNTKKRALPKQSIPTLEPIKKRRVNKYVSKNVEKDGGYKCKECGKVYKYICNLRSHSKIHTPDAHVCEFCNKRFGRKANYVEHKRVHTGEQPFKCKVCGKGFKQRFGWKDHMKTHKRN